MAWVSCGGPIARLDDDDNDPANDPSDICDCGYADVSDPNDLLSVIATGPMLRYPSILESGPVAMMILPAEARLGSNRIAPAAHVNRPIDTVFLISLFLPSFMP